MTDEQFNTVIKTIEATVKTTVNGKIDNINNKLDDYIVSDEAWKKTAGPVIDMGKSLQGFGKVAGYAFGFIAGVGGVFQLFTMIFKKN